MIFLNNYDIIALLTDFGYDDWYVATLKGIIKKINPNVEIIDISHSVDSHNIKKAAFILKSVYKYYPTKTIFVCVIDPGVGSEQKSIIYNTQNYAFVCPDNGLLTYVYQETHGDIYEILKQNFFDYIYPNSQISSTFHARDIYSPVAAHLSKGIKIENFSNKIPEIVQFSNAEFKKENSTILCEVIYTDKFGNVFFSIKKEDIPQISNYNEVQIFKNDKLIANVPLGNTFSNTNVGSAVCYFGSENYLELAINQGSAKNKFSLNISDQIKIVLI